MYGYELFLKERNSDLSFEKNKWEKKGTRLIFRIGPDAFFPTYLAVAAPG